jgi:UDP-N-acetylglucosamine 4,6-dehydratase/5-epimerase
MFKDKKILVTGGTGSIGSEIVRSLGRHKPRVIRVLSNDENAMFNLRNELGDKGYRYLVGDVRDRERMLLATSDIDIIYHCAALKHVPLCEYNPFEAILTNVIGTHNVLDAAIFNDVERLVNISTDKACNPVSTMGATKLLTEKLIADMNQFKTEESTITASVRFGNVMRSRGSVIPLWEEQIRMGKPITITDPEMTRYMMTIPDAVGLIFKATEMMKGGEVFILKMKKIRLGDLADEVVAGRNVSRMIIGLRPGEKMHEELMTHDEQQIALETDDMFIIPFSRSK